MGIGGAWFEQEHRAFGIDFGSGFGQRLDWLAEAVPAMRALLDGERSRARPAGATRSTACGSTRRPSRPTCRS